MTATTTVNFAPLVQRVEAAIQDRSGHYPSIRHPSYDALIAAINDLYDGLYQAYPSVTIDVPLDIDAQLEAMLDHAIMVAGAAKSGTSLLRNLLDAHPQIFALPSQGALMRTIGWHQRGIPEEEIYAQISQRILQTLISHDLGGGPHWLLSEGQPAHEPYLDFVALTFRRFRAGPQTPVNFFRAQIYALAYVHLMQNPGSEVPTRWLEQSPSGLRRTDWLTRDFPHVAVLYGVRDPRAVFASTKFRHVSKFHNFDLHNFVEYVQFEWRLVDEIMSGDASLKHRIMHYEKLVTEPDDVLRSTLEFLNLPFDEQTLSPSVLGIPARANTAYKDARKTQIFTGSIDRWRERLTPEEVTVAERLFGPTSARGGYDLPATSYTDYAGAVFRMKQQYQAEGLKLSIPRLLRQGLRPPA